MLALGKLFAAGIHNEGVVQVNGAPVGWNLERWVALAGVGNQLGERDLAGGGIADVFAADNVGDSFGEVVDADGKLVSPEAVSVADREIATLLFRVFGEIAEKFVVPVNYFVCNCDAEAVGLATGESLRAAFALVNDFAGFAHGVFGLQLLAAAGAGVYEALGGELVEDFLEKIKVAALDAFAVELEAEPGEIFADAVDVFLAGAALVVVFDAQVDFEVPFLCGSAHVKGGKQVPFV